LQNLLGPEADKVIELKNEGSKQEVAEALAEA
jgi:hypothetical protein